MSNLAGDLPGEIARALLVVMQYGWGRVSIVIENGRIKLVEVTTTSKPPQEEGQEDELVRVLEKGIESE